jgi:serine/threonine protein kinase
MAKKPTRAAYPAHYDLLEVSPRARHSVIQAAYRALSKEHHPDQPNGDAKLFGQIASAYEVIGDSDKRAAYDQSAKTSCGDMVGNYRIISEIAEGGFGTTYLGEHIVAQEPVCIKHCHQVSAMHQETLIQEAKAIWDLRHYSLPVMRDFVKLDDGSLALVMSYIPGLTLEKIIEREKRLDPEDVAWITQRVLDALKYLHYNGVVHGDIKPQNIIVQEETHSIVLVDFGLSVVKPTRNSGAKGYTPVYASPEQLGDTPLLPQSDFYSLALTMLYALSGDIDKARALRVPDVVPKPLCEFFLSFLTRSPLGRPSWDREDLVDSLKKVRLESFGRIRTNLKCISGSSSH